jgi:group I intron endonuclease
MVNYQNGKIYKMINDVNNEIYIGSTVKRLCNRMAQHRTNTKDINNKSKVYIKMREIGIEHFKIVLLEKYACLSKEELRAREDHYINLLKPPLNTINAVKNEIKFQQTRKKNRKDYC